jgi:hypothetical protein
LNGHNSCGYNDIIPETKNEYDIETMVGSWFNNQPVLHNIARSYITDINVIERSTKEHITAPIKSTTAKYGMKNCPSFMGFILYPYTNITRAFPRIPMMINNTKSISQS